MLDKISPDLLFISPGPGLPIEQKIPELVSEALKREIPIFGVCLGHQGIAEHFGGKLMTLENPVHGKSTMIMHNGDSFYLGLENPFRAGRYHSLYVDQSSLPDSLEVTARTDSGLIMGLRHKILPVASVQFHPESILTLKDQSGLRMINRVVGELAKR